MQQYIIIAYDGTDSGATERRMSVRPEHFKTARELKANNNFVIGGAMLDENGKMNGSMMIVQFETVEQLRQWMENEPYINGKVWQQVEVKPFKVAVV